jgi:hypothetical protein
MLCLEAGSKNIWAVRSWQIFFNSHVTIARTCWVCCNTTSDRSVCELVLWLISFCLAILCDLLRCTSMQLSQRLWMLTIPPVDVDPNPQDMIFIFFSKKSVICIWVSNLFSNIDTWPKRMCSGFRRPHYYPLCGSLYAFGLDLQAQAKMRWSLPSQACCSLCEDTIDFFN